MLVGLIISLVAAAGTAISMVHQGQVQKNWANYQAKKEENDAKAEVAASMVEADNLRRAARRQRAAAAAQLAGSGIALDSGMALAIDEDIAQRGEEDALTTILNAGNSAAQRRANAEALRIQGSQALKASYINAGNTVLSAAGDAAMSYSKYGAKGKTKTTTPGNQGRTFSTQPLVSGSPLAIGGRA
jgi:hypothetical protein